MRLRTILTASIFIGVVSSCFADLSLAKGLDLESKMRFRTDQDSIDDEYFTFDAELKLKYETKTDFDFRMESELDRDGVRLSELWGRYKFDEWRMKAGMFENILLGDDFLSGERCFFSSDNIVSERLRYMGWYSSAATGVSLYRNAKDDESAYGVYSHAFFHPSSAEFQFDVGGYWAYAGEDTFLGGIAAYYPFFIHDAWYGDSSYVQKHNFLMSVYAADFREEKAFVYKVEALVASNLIDPVGFIHFPSGTDGSLFFGTCTYFGFPIAGESVVVTPGLRFSYLMHSFEQPRSNDMEYVFSGTFRLHDVLTMNGGIGIGTSTYYEAKWVTALELLWNLEVSVRI